MRIKTLLLSIFFIGLFNVSNVAPVNAQSAKLTAKVDSLFAEYNKPGRPGAAVGVVH